MQHSYFVIVIDFYNQWLKSVYSLSQKSYVTQRNYASHNKFNVMSSLRSQLISVSRMGMNHIGSWLLMEIHFMFVLSFWSSVYSPYFSWEENMLPSATVFSHWQERSMPVRNKLNQVLDSQICVSRCKSLFVLVSVNNYLTITKYIKPPALSFNNMLILETFL